MHCPAEPDPRDASGSNSKICHLDLKSLAQINSKRSQFLLFSNLPVAEAGVALTGFPLSTSLNAPESESAASDWIGPFGSLQLGTRLHLWFTFRICRLCRKLSGRVTTRVCVVNGNGRNSVSMETGNLPDGCLAAFASSVLSAKTSTGGSRGESVGREGRGTDPGEDPGTGQC